MNPRISAIGIFLSVGVLLTLFACNNMPKRSQVQQDKMMNPLSDGRIPLGLSPQRKKHQLANMRSHVEAIRMIVGFMGEGNFEAASKTAHLRLGLTDEMKKMCNMFENEAFRNLGLQFHKSADHLSEILKTKDLKKSLHAVKVTLGYCVQCHATFRQ